MMDYISSLYWVNTPPHVLGPFVAHHQEVECKYVANGTLFTSKSFVGRLTLDLEVKQVLFATYMHSTS
jgi:hypothetical protein